jgi:MFS-type transporter involved in bile tolerance (Atg22 family)
MCPLLQWRLSLPMKLWYSYGTWTYIVNIFSVPMALLIPFLSLGFGLNPVVVNYWFAAAATPYYACIFLVQTYFHKLDHIKSLWFAGISNVVLSFTYTKAVMNVLLSKGGLKEKGGFKATVKKVGPRKTRR